MAVFSFANVNAQSASDKRAAREALLAAQIQALAEDVELNAEQTSQFDEVYRAYRKALRGTQQKQIKAEEMTEDIALQNIAIAQDNVIGKATTRKEFAAQFAAVMPAKSVSKLYKNEDKILKKVQKEMKEKN